MAKNIIATVVMPIEEITSTDVTWYLSAKDLQELGVTDVNELQDKIRNREIDMFDLPADGYETIYSEIHEVYPGETDVIIDGDSND